MTKTEKKYIGKKFGKLTIISLSTEHFGSKNRINRTRLIAKVSCVCGTVKQVKVDNLASGCTRSCGCIIKVHGHAALKTKTDQGFKWYPSRTYVSWKYLKVKCKGGGTNLSKRWASFSNFLEDMGERPENTSLKKVDKKFFWETRKVRAKRI